MIFIMTVYRRFTAFKCPEFLLKLRNYSKLASLFHTLNYQHSHNFYSFECWHLLKLTHVSDSWHPLFLKNICNNRHYKVQTMTVFTMKRYASAVYAVIMCASHKKSKLEEFSASF